MRIVRLSAALLVIAAWTMPAMARAESAEQSAARGKALLAQGDLEAAMAAYGAAARADEGNRAYVQQYTVVRRMIQVRKRLRAEKDPERWQYLARALHAFYISQGIYTKALELDEQIHARLGTAASAVALAETQLAMELNAEAAKTLSALGPERATATTRALLGVALARDGKMDEARRLAAGVKVPEKAGPRMVYSAARLQGATGNADEALKLLAHCFTSAAPSLLEGYKAHARQCPEFAALASTVAFADVLKTESAVPESKCSGGSGCANCPMRGKCGHGQGAGE